MLCMCGPQGRVHHCLILRTTRDTRHELLTLPSKCIQPVYRHTKRHPKHSFLKLVALCGSMSACYPAAFCVYMWRSPAVLANRVPPISLLSYAFAVQVRPTGRRSLIKTEYWAPVSSSSYKRHASPLRPVCAAPNPTLTPLG